MLFVVRKNRLSLKINNFTILRVFQMISLKWIKSLTDFSMPELHLKQPGNTYNACGPFTKHRERIQKFRKQVI